MSKMNLPNRLTMLRLCLVPVCMALLLLPASLLRWEIAYGAGLVLFILTSLTDMFDGKIARARNLITNFGKFMDPVADKFMVIGTMMALLFRMLNPAIYGLSYRTPLVAVYFATVVAIIFRELAITSLRLVLVNASGQVVAANILGKIKTVSQIVAICTLLVEPLIDKLICHFAPDFFAAGVYPLTWLFVAVTLVFTLWSGFNYIKGGWKLISTDW
ncbi:MAG: CDP-diacylglycerol--glycerol-3-phosphate 3-phosphatidyltransferase [Clostridia bacterium]|nr:CDP-diacylglycerol--glycerol-3-phosphate 3-phosphatidyltransferase [Clostridia bacterium]